MFLFSDQPDELCYGSANDFTGMLIAIRSAQQAPGWPPCVSRRAGGGVPLGQTAEKAGCVCMRRSGGDKTWQFTLAPLPPPPIGPPPSRIWSTAHDVKDDLRCAGEVHSVFRPGENARISWRLRRMPRCDRHLGCSVLVGSHPASRRCSGLVDVRQLVGCRTCRCGCSHHDGVHDHRFVLRMFGRFHGDQPDLFQPSRFNSGR